MNCCQMPAATDAKSVTTSAGTHVPTLRPSVDIYERDGSLTLVANVPGIGESEVDVTLERNVLTIRTSARPEEPEGLTAVYHESRRGRFERSFTVPQEIDRDRIEATVENGVLRISLPRREDAGRKKIDISSN